MVRLGNHLFVPKETVALAPMAGVADRSFRKLCVQLGAGLVTGEMASAMALTLNDKKTDELLCVDVATRPAGVQIFGASPQRMADCLEKVLPHKPDFVDINMGCPAPKVVNTGAGSALMKDPALAEEIVKAVLARLEATAQKQERPALSVKMRLGFESPQGAVEFAKRMEQAGVDFLTVHGRTRQEMYAGHAHWNAIGEVVRGVSIPVIGNGDVRTGPDAKRMLEQTGCALVAVGRGARTNPFVFGQISHFLKTGEQLPPATPKMRAEALQFVVEDMIALKGEYIALREGRKLAAWFTAGCKGAAALRKQAFCIASVQDLAAFLETYLQYTA